MNSPGSGGHMSSRRASNSPLHSSRAASGVSTPSKFITANSPPCARAASTRNGESVTLPVGSVRRYQLVRSVPALRDREIAWVSTYVRLFGRYLHRRLGEAPTAALAAQVGASAVVAAHNQVLREWLHGGGNGDPLPALERAFDWVVSRLAPVPPEGSEVGDNVVVAVFRAGEPLDDVMERISRSF